MAAKQMRGLLPVIRPKPFASPTCGMQKHSLFPRCSQPLAHVPLTSQAKRMYVQPRTYPKCSFVPLPEHERFEEERYFRFKPENFYPVKLGDVFESRYQVVAKLGYGTASTVWLCRDLKQNSLVTLKFCVLGEEKTQEVAVSHYIRSIDADHPGRERLRVTLDEFHVKGPHGTHQCLIFPALGMTLAQLRDLFEDKALEKTLLQKFLCMVLLGLDFLHQAGVVHTDLSPHNILVGADDVTVSKVEEAELANPSPRKILADRTIHLSYAMPTSYRAPVITDFGSAHIGTPGQKFHGDVMPGVYRAPEIIAGLEWDSKIDIWSFGVMIWDLFEGRSLFSAVRNGSLDDELHFAGMVSLMGPPPKKFLESSQKCRQYWDTQGEVLYGLIAGLCEEATLTKQGNWIAETPIPDQTLESRETRLSGGDKQLLLALARKIFRWLPEDRPSAQDLYKDGFLSQWESEGTDSGSEVPS